MDDVSDPSAPSGTARPATAEGARAFVITPFTRLARLHATSTAADAMVAASLAGTIFFSMPAGTARVPVLRFLIVTMIPFGVVSPLIGPAIDRMKGGHRLMVLGSCAARAVLCFLLISNVPALHSKKVPLAFYPLALLILVGGKAYGIARSALVPTVVRSDSELVKANGKLSEISNYASVVGVVPAFLVGHFLGVKWSIGLAAITYAAATMIGLKIPRGRVATEKADITERHELRGVSIIMAGSAMGLIRACVGFLTVLVAFDFRGNRPAWEAGVVAGASVVANTIGAKVGPRVRAVTNEENLLTGTLVLLVLAGVFALVGGDLWGATAVAGAVGFAAGAGRVAFDSILQRDAPDANRGRAFARFETRFQVAWAVGAIIPVLPGIHISVGAGMALILLVALFALGSYLVARLSYAHRTGTSQNAATAAAVEIEERFSEVSSEVKGALASGGRQLFRKLRPRPVVDDPGADPALRPHVAEAHVDAVSGGPLTAFDQDRTPPPGLGGALDPELASSSPVAWQPPPDEHEPTYPWEPPAEPDAGPSEYLADLDASVANPFPWTPDDPTRHAPGEGIGIDPDGPTQVAGTPGDPGPRPRPRGGRPGQPSQVVRQRRRRRR